MRVIRFFVMVALTMCLFGLPAIAQAASVQAAWALYNQQKFAPSADMFESLIRTSPPSARLYYYAALANKGANRSSRAKQLCQYVTANFGSSTEATYARKLFPDLAAAPAGGGSGAGASGSLPDSLKGKNFAELMQTEEGRKAVEEALAKKEAALATVTPMVAKTRGARAGNKTFSAADIAKDGAGGIDQMSHPNCWFESSMSALAMLPRGQSLMADMIKFGPKEGTYVVRFPNDGSEYNIDEALLDRTGIHDKALWATLIECAQTLKFPNDDGGLLSDGLGCLTGRKAETVSPSSATEQELTAFIDGAVKSKNPIVCGTYQGFGGMPYIVFPSHAYTIIGYDTGSCMVKLRNPHGANSERFSLDSDPNHRKFEQLEDGCFKMHISLFSKYFSQVARSFI